VTDTAAPFFPSSTIKEAAHWGTFLGREWIRDFPDRLHDAGLVDDGTPQRWSNDLSRFLEGAADEGNRGRTTRVMRKLRRTAPREYEVMYQAMVLGHDFNAITAWLNERALRNNIPLPANREVHYRVKDAVALFIAGVDYARAHW
jgi:hypothetical protein